MISSMLRNPQLAPPKRSRLPWQVVLPWAIAGAILVVTLAVAFLPRGVKSDPSPPGQTGALVWGNGVFANKLELEAWLRIRGVSYETWAKKHPAAVKLLEQN
jgi:hypothetical protein